MTGPQHFAEAERLIADSDTSDHTYAAQALARAQVHATLAQAAATIDATRIHPEGWLDVLNTTNP